MRRATTGAPPAGREAPQEDERGDQTSGYVTSEPSSSRDASRFATGVTVPVVLAEPYDRATWRVLCAFCARWHWHGRGEPGGTDTGERVAHCGGGTYRLVRRGEVPRRG